jgi:quercetin dioxygenase-like cupin family protein
MADDAVTAAPHVYKILVENDRVRVLEARLKPGYRTPMHSHPANVAVAIRDGKFNFTLADGLSSHAEMKAGDVMYFDAVEHSTENATGEDVHAVLIELK